MKFGFITTEGGAYFKEALEEAVYGEELGFDSVWLEEHHSIRNHYWPSPLMALAGIATRTDETVRNRLRGDRASGAVSGRSSVPGTLFESRRQET